MKLFAIVVSALAIGVVAFAMTLPDMNHERRHFVDGCENSGMPRHACELDWADRAWRAQLAQRPQS